MSKLFNLWLIGLNLFKRIILIHIFFKKIIYCSILIINKFAKLLSIIFLFYYIKNVFFKLFIISLFFSKYSVSLNLF